MRSRFGIMACALALGLAHVGEGAKMTNPKERHQMRMASGPKIKVLLAKDIPAALLEVKGDYRVIRTDMGTLLSSGSTGKRFVVHGMKEGIRWGEEYPEVYQIALVPASPNTMMYVNGFQYKGTLFISQGEHNRITIVNDIAIEDYLKSILAYKVESSVAREALSALAITARTEAAFRCFNVESDEVWNVVAKEVGYYGHGVTMGENHVNEIVDLTRNMVMEKPGLNEAGQLFAAGWTRGKNAPSNEKLSIASADEMARRGYDARKILQTYFPNTRLTALDHA